MIGILLNPNTHVQRPPQTITHNWTISTGFRSPDGVKKQVYLVNNQFPGPLIECRSGDRLVVHVTNSLASGDGVSLHWHGLAMRNANNMDGAVGITQCPIPANATFTYKFDVGDDPGTFWWHGHSQMQRGDGLYGGLIVHKASTTAREYDDEILLLIGDWYHKSSNDVLNWYQSAWSFGNEPVPDSLLVNGAGKFICSMAVPANPLQCVDNPEKQYLGIFGKVNVRTRTRLRVVNVGSLAGFTLQISSTTLTPFTVDGGFQIDGYAADTVGILYPGERADLLLDWNDSPEQSQLHIYLDTENFKFPNPSLRRNQTFPIISSTPSSSTQIPPIRKTHFNLANARSLEPATNLPAKSDQTILVYAKSQKLAIDDNIPTGYINRTTWKPQFPALINLPRAQWNNFQQVPFIPLSLNNNNNSRPMWIDLVINNLDDGAHPFHLHGHAFHVLASARAAHGWGSYSPFADDSKNRPVLELHNPVVKDTVSVPRRGFVVVRFKADNPGLWMLHCHMLFHQGSGMAMALHVGDGEMHEDIDVLNSDFCNK
ncbi:hypothetical protein HK100_007707 [Physocladia obscura]|uniref:Laccase n=1 Tax=Physocladia obscura TaxID=109957 RepID=A0AAD5SQH4_9FUNG|nr:hypothetical protein HK100_007707 [Physocladia obscura]